MKGPGGGARGGLREEAVGGGPGGGNEGPQEGQAPRRDRERGGGDPGGLRSVPGNPSPQVFSLIVFSSLLTDGYQNKTESSRLHCVFNSNSVACSFAVGAGLLAFVTCLAFLALDTHESRLGSPRFKTAFQLLDCIVAGEHPPIPRPAGHSLPPTPPPPTRARSLAPPF